MSNFDRAIAELKIINENLAKAIKEIEECIKIVRGESEGEDEEHKETAMV